ncbi:SMC5-SMC6 complex component Non-SMC element 1 isoform X2 [Choristoneura fumiferana]|uniref:SMC5-SMC6 complex component Non-SMC element 1 isoform X2 n=1 Tax=Choristoneura fumiferana TaxID=7141 RepID=UPI003D1557F2
MNYDNNEISIDNLVKEINEKIKPLHQQIKISNDELTDEQVVVFICLGHDEATKSQNVFSAMELEYFRLLLEEIMSIETRQITGILAMNLVNRLKTSSFTKTHGQKLLDTWCRMRYLDKDENNYALGMRAIHEFQTYLRQNMPDTIEECFLCKEIVFRGYNCPSCAKAVHTRCLNRYLDKVQKWPCCKADFSESQLERLNAESSRITQTQVLDETSQQSAEYNTIVGNTQDLSQDVEMTQDLFPEITSDLMPEISQEMLQELSQEEIPEVSQRVTRKRKRN